MTMWDQISDGARDMLVHEMIAALPASGVPEHLRRSFLQSVLTNNLRHAVMRGDPESLAGLSCIVQFLNTYAPATSWGSRAAVRGWSTTPERLEV